MADTSSRVIPLHAAQRTAVARGGTLEGFLTEATAGAGVALRTLDPLTALLVETRNSRYHIIVSQGDEIVVQGGPFFEDPTPAHLDGASLGGSLLKLGWIGIGLRMEIRAGQRRIVTSAVRSIVRADLRQAARTH